MTSELPLTALFLRPDQSGGCTEQTRYRLSCEQNGEGLRQPPLVLRTKCLNHSIQEETSQLTQLSSAPCLEEAPQSQTDALEQLSKNCSGA